MNMSILPHVLLVRGLQSLPKFETEAHPVRALTLVWRSMVYRGFCLCLLMAEEAKGHKMADIRLLSRPEKVICSFQEGEDSW